MPGPTVTSAQAAATAAIHQVARFLIAAGVKPAQAGKAVALLLEEGGLVDAATPGARHATSSDGTTTYLVGTTFCTCPSTSHCYHQLAAIIRAAAAGVPQP